MKQSLLFILITIPSLNAISPEEYLQQMSLRQKIGQLIIAAAVSNEERNTDFMATSPYRMDSAHIEQLITEYHIGGVIFLGSSFTDEIKSMIEQFQTLANHQLLIALDAEWPTMRLKNLPPELQLPKHITLGIINDPALTHDVAYIIGIILRHLGIHINLAPVADVNNNPHNPVIGARSFGDNPACVALHVLAYWQGLQKAGILGCAKHFPGHGDTAINSHVAMPIIAHDQAHLKAIELVPFVTAINGGIPLVMTAHLQVPAYEPDTNIPATLSKRITTDLLRNTLGFEGLIITDGLGMKGITDYHQLGQLEVEALEAGADILLCPVNVPQAIQAIEQAVLSGRLSGANIDTKVLKILYTKEKAFAATQEPLLSWQELVALSSQLKKRL